MNGSLPIYGANGELVGLLIGSPDLLERAHAGTRLDLVPCMMSDGSGAGGLALVDREVGD